MKKKFVSVLMSALVCTQLFTPVNVSAATTLYDNKTGTEGGCDYRPNGNSYLCVYGWTVDPLIEYYVVDSWGTWRPPGASSKGQISVDGGTYDVYETTRYNQPSIQGNTTFKQYWSVRTSKKTSGTISVTEHFKAWEKFGMKCGKLYETALTVEGYQSSGSAKVYKNNIAIGGSGSQNSGSGSSEVQPENPTSVNTKSSIECEAMTLSGTYAGKISSPFSGVALYANNDKAAFNQQFGYNTHDFTLRGCSSNSKTATVELRIDGEKKGTFNLAGSTPKDYTLKNITHKTGSPKIELVCVNDDNTWDAYIDSFKIGAAGSTGSDNQGETTEPTQPSKPTQPSEPTQPSASGISCKYTKTGDWGSGFQGELLITNNTDKTLNGWQLTFDTAAKISSLWGGELVGKTGNTVTVKNSSWDTSFTPGKSITIGFVAEGSSSNEPTNIKVNNMSVNQGESTQPSEPSEPTQPAEPSEPSEPTQPAEGKIVRPGDVKVVTSTPSNVTRQQAGVTYGQVKSGTYYSNITNSNRPYNIYLPAGYTPSKKYPVIYMLHGIGGNQNAFGNSISNSTLMRMAGNMMASGECKEAIIVFPYIRVSNTAETNIFSAQNYKYYDLFREELINNLMPHINKTYSTKTGRENTAVAGFSMGGRESLYIGISKADLFGYTAAFCPAPGNLPNTMNGVSEPGLFTTSGFKLPAAYNENSLVMIVKGASDNVVGDQPLLYHNTLSANGTDHVYYQIPGGHDEGVYGNGFYNFLRYAFK